MCSVQFSRNFVGRKFLFVDLVFRFVSFVVMPKRNLDHETREKEDEIHEKKLTK